MWLLPVKMKNCGMRQMLACACCAVCHTGLDIAAMMEAWLADVSAACNAIQQLAGYSNGMQQAGNLQSQHQQDPMLGRPRVVRPGDSNISPLVASSDARSHAPHLSAQLGLHQACLDHMKGMKAALASSMVTTGMWLASFARHDVV
jgi:hypothetical protein